MIFDQEYYQSVNYVDYLNRKDRYVQLADEVMSHLKVHNLDKGPILDFGCAVGFLLESLHDLGYKDSYGSDISDWAIQEAKKKDLIVWNQPCYGTTHGVVFSLDVFEHMSEKELDDFMQSIQTKIIVFRIPIRQEGDDDYFLECSRADPTHVICWTKNQWEEYFRKHEYITLDLNLHTIYNSTGVYAGVALSNKHIKREFEK